MNFADIVVIFSVTALVATAVLIIYKAEKQENAVAAAIVHTAEGAEKKINLDISVGL